jgi:hypothetical protein
LLPVVLLPVVLLPVALVVLPVLVEVEARPVEVEDEKDDDNDDDNVLAVAPPVCITSITDWTPSLAPCSRRRRTMPMREW